MALTRQTAIQIVDAVRADAEAYQRIDSVLKWPYYFNPRYAGVVRNAAMAPLEVANNLIYGNSDKGVANDRKIHELDCRGIAAQTTKVINEAIKQQKVKSARGAKECERLNALNADHVATEIKMEDGTYYVFDWHETLDVNYPIIYRLDDWHRCQGGISFTSFAGF